MNRNMIGAAASAAWIEQHGLDASRTPHWYVEITIPTDSPGVQFEINIYPEEWGVIFRREHRVSSLRVTDIPFIHGLDEHRLLPDLPPLDRIDDLLALLERREGLAFHRARATVRSNLNRATSMVRAWLVGKR